MEVIIILTKTVADQVEAEQFANQARTFIENNPPLNSPGIQINIESRDTLTGQ